MDRQRPSTNCYSKRCRSFPRYRVPVRFSLLLSRETPTWDSNVLVTLPLSNLSFSLPLFYSNSMMDEWNTKKLRRKDETISAINEQHLRIRRWKRNIQKCISYRRDYRTMNHAEETHLDIGHPVPIRWQDSPPTAVAKWLASHSDVAGSYRPKSRSIHVIDRCILAASCIPRKICR